LDGENISGDGLNDILKICNGHQSIKNMNICIFFIFSHYLDANKSLISDIENSIALLKANPSSLKICIGIFMLFTNIS